MLHRSAPAAAMLTSFMIALSLTACTPTPSPTPAPMPSPMPTGFASERDAFAAAESTYRAYVDAVNQIDYTDPDTFEPVFALTSGPAHDDDRRAFMAFYDDRSYVIGNLVVDRFAPRSWEPAESQVEIDACLDLSATDVIDGEGNSTVLPTRASFLPVLVTLRTGDSQWGLRIVSVSPRESGEPC